MSLPTPAHGQILLALDNVVYRVRISVERVPADAAPGYIGRHECDWPAWAATWPGRLAAAQAEARRALEQQAALGQQLAATEIALADAQAQITRLTDDAAAAVQRGDALALQVAAQATPISPADDDRGYPCRFGCGHISPRTQGRAAHERACEANPERAARIRAALAAPPAASPEPAPEPEPEPPPPAGGGAPEHPGLAGADASAPASPMSIRMAILQARHRHAASLISTLPEDARQPWRQLLAQAEEARAHRAADALNLARRAARQIADGAIRASLLSELDDEPQAVAA